MRRREHQSVKSTNHLFTQIINKRFMLSLLQRLRSAQLCASYIRASLPLLTALGVFACLLPLPTRSQKVTPNAQRPSTLPASSTPDTGIVHSQKMVSGVPLGGIGAGTFQLLTDGTVSRATLADNWQHPGEDAPGCFGAVWMQANGRSTARVLALNNAYSLPTTAKVDYDGLFPQAQIAYADPALPVSISLLAFSPLVPFDLKNSSFPGAAFVMRIKNPSAALMDVSVALSWESLLPAFGTQNGTAAIIPSGDGFFGARFTTPDPDTEMTLMAYPSRAQATVTAGLWNAGDAQPGWWAQFAREGSVPETASGMTLNAARPAAAVAVRLSLKPGEATEIPFAVCWYKKHLRVSTGEEVGHYYEVPFANAQNAARQLLEDWRSLYGLTEEWQKRLTFSNLPRWQARRLINSAAPLFANTIHTRDGRFAFLGTVGNTSRMSAPSPSVNAIMPPDSSLSAREMEQDETRAHQTAQTLLLALFPQLAAQELKQFAVTQDTRGFVVPPAAEDWARRLGPPQPATAPLIPTADTLLSGLTPAKSAATAGGGAKMSPTAKPSPAPHSNNSAPLPSSTGKTAPTLPPPYIAFPSPALAPLDATAAYVLQWAQFMLWTGDTDFFQQHYPTLRRALHALIPHLSILSSSSTLHLAALRAGGMLAKMGNDDALARECEAAFKAGSARLEARRWNGEFYAEDSSSASISDRKPNVLPADICASDQLWGQWLAYQLDLGPLLPPAHLARAAQSLQQRNDSLIASALLPPWQVRADGAFPAVPAARKCLLPASILADAVVNIWQDQPEVGVNLLYRLDQARTTVLRSPWQYPARVEKEEKEKRRKEEEEIQFTTKESSTLAPQLSTLAVAADWNVLYALQGFALDLNAGRMTLAPNIPGTWRSLIAPVFAPTFWGRMEYRPTAHGGVTTLRLDRLIGFVTSSAPKSLLDRAQLTLKTLRVQGPPRRQDNALPATFTAHISVGTKSIGSRSVLDTDGFVTLTFDSPLSLTAGDRLEVDIH